MSTLPIHINAIFHIKEFAYSDSYINQDIVRTQMVGIQSKNIDWQNIEGGELKSLGWDGMWGDDNLNDNTDFDVDVFDEFVNLDDDVKNSPDNLASFGQTSIAVSQHVRADKPQGLVSISRGVTTSPANQLGEFSIYENGNAEPLLLNSALQQSQPPLKTAQDNSGILVGNVARDQPRFRANEPVDLSNAYKHAPPVSYGDWHLKDGAESTLQSLNWARQSNVGFGNQPGLAEDSYEPIVSPPYTSMDANGNLEESVTRLFGSQPYPVVEFAKDLRGTYLLGLALPMGDKLKDMNRFSDVPMPPFQAPQGACNFDTSNTTLDGQIPFPLSTSQYAVENALQSPLPQYRVRIGIFYFCHQSY
jgi:hypothetical protein